MAISKISTKGMSGDTLDAGDIAPNAIGASELADNAVDTAAIAANAVTTAKITNLNVTAAKFSSTALASVEHVKPHIQPDVLYPAVEGNDLDGTDIDTSHGSTYTYGTAHADGRKYYYTDIKGSKPIKDPRIGSHFGSQRHNIDSMQLLEQETATHGKNVYSMDGREWMRAIQGSGQTLEIQNNSNGNRVVGNGADVALEFTGYFRDVNYIGQTYASDNRSFTVTLDGTTGSEVNTFNAESIADSKFSKTNVQIDNMQPIGGKILANKDIRTTADVLAFVEQYNGNVSAIKQAVIGLIINDVFEGNIANMSNSDMVNLADSVMLDIGTLMSDSYGSTENSENTSVGENIVTNTDSKEDSVVEEDKKDDIVLAEVLQKGTEEESTKSEGIGDEPYLFSDGSFNPNFDPSILEGGEFEAGTPRRDYEIAKARYEARQRVLKNKEDTEKIKKGATFIWENLIKGDKFKKDN